MSGENNNDSYDTKRGTGASFQIQGAAPGIFVLLLMRLCRSVPISLALAWLALAAVVAHGFRIVVSTSAGAPRIHACTRKWFTRKRPAFLQLVPLRLTSSAAKSSVAQQKAVLLPVESRRLPRRFIWRSMAMCWRVEWKDPDHDDDGHLAAGTYLARFLDSHGTPQSSFATVEWKDFPAPHERTAAAMRQWLQTCGDTGRLFRLNDRSYVILGAADNFHCIGAVFFARNQATGEDVVIKLPAVDYWTREDHQREKAILHHMGMLRDAHDPTMLLIQKRIHGATMQSLIENALYSDYARLRSIMEDTLQRFNRKRILHGDPHADNVIVDRAGVGFMIDFGWARMALHGEQDNLQYFEENWWNSGPEPPIGATIDVDGQKFTVVAPRAREERTQVLFVPAKDETGQSVLVKGYFRQRLDLNVGGRTIPEYLQAEQVSQSLGAMDRLVVFEPYRGLVVEKDYRQRGVSVAQYLSHQPNPQKDLAIRLQKLAVERAHLQGILLREDKSLENIVVDDDGIPHFLHFHAAIHLIRVLGPKEIQKELTKESRSIRA